MASRRIEDLRFADILTFLAVHRHRSVTAAARELRVTASQVSKAIARLEEAVRTPLLIRGSRGVTASPSAGKLIPRFEQLVERARELATSQDVEDQLAIAAPSYLCTGFLPAILTAMQDTRLRILEVGPAYIRAYASENIFGVALTLGEQKLTPAWISESVGTIRSSLLARPLLAKKLLAGKPYAQIDDVREVPFVIPLYSAGGEFLPSDDGCPLPREERIRGHEAATYGVGLEIASEADMLVFGPITAARLHTESGKLVEVRVRDWDVRSTLYVHANGDRIMGPLHKRIVGAIRDAATKAE
jgi:DNA-binding transcriptional LysR family regulator